MSLASADVIRGDGFESLYREHAAAVRELIRRKVRDRDRVEDLVQETFLRLHQHRDRIDDRPVVPLLRTIALNLCIDDARARRRRPDPEPEMDVSDPSWHRDPSKSLDAREQRDAILSAFRVLSPRDMRLIVSRDVDGMAYKDIATLESLSDDALKSALKRARSSFRSAYLRLVDEHPGVAALIPVGLLGRLRRRVSSWASSPTWRAIAHHDLAGIAGTAAIVGAALIGPAASIGSAEAGVPEHAARPQLQAAAVDVASEPTTRTGDAPLPPGPLAAPDLVDVPTRADVGSDGEWLSANHYLESFLPVDTEWGTEIKTECNTDLRRTACDAVAEHDPDQPGDEER